MCRISRKIARNGLKDIWIIRKLERERDRETERDRQREREMRERERDRQTK